MSMSLRKRQVMSSLVGVAGMVIIAAILVVVTRATASNYENVITGRLAARGVVHEIGVGAGQMSMAGYGKVSAKNPSAAAAFTARLEKVSAETAEKAKKLTEHPGVVDAEVSAVVKTLISDFTRFQTALAKSLELVQANQLDAADKLFVAQVVPAGDAVQAGVGEVRAALSKAVATEITTVRWEQTLSISAALAVAVLVAGVGVWIAMRLSMSLLGAATGMQRIAKAMEEGDLSQRIRSRTQDEFGIAATRMNSGMQRLSTLIEETGKSATALSSTSEQLQSFATAMDDQANQTDQQAQLTSQACEEITRSVATLAAGAEEMTASIKEIAQSASKAAEVARDAVGIASLAATATSKLGQSSAEIASVLSVIDEIASQTNLLALNATIEAARAGEAGKGFAVVANEVKNLAAQTAKATEDISKRIGVIRTDVENSSAEMKKVSEVINRVSDYQTTIASAVEEQTATTNEMSRNIQEAARGTEEISTNIATVASNAQKLRAGMVETRQVATELSRVSGTMRDQVSVFRTRPMHELDGEGREIHVSQSAAPTTVAELRDPAVRLAA